MTNRAKTVPIILGSNANALGVVRSLGENGVNSIVADSEKGVAGYSKYARFVQVEDCTQKRAAFSESLLRIGSDLEAGGQKGIIYCCTDGYLYAVGENYAELSKHFIIMMSEWKTVERCLDKSFLYQEAERLGIPCPRTYIAENVRALPGCKDKVPFPVLIKPAVTVGFSSVYKKAVIAIDEEDLRRIQQEICAHGLEDYILLVQEIIPGPVTNLYTFAAYSDKTGSVKAYSIGHKIRQSPPETGAITAGRVTDAEALHVLGVKCIKELGFHGISNTEFKLDPRDGLFKLIEVNPRPGLYNYSATAAGVNLSWASYKDAVLNLQGETESSRKEVVWIYDFTDFVRAVYSNKRKGWPEYHISVRDWFRSVKGKKVYAVWNPRDPKPLFAYIAEMFAKKFRH